MKVKEYKDRKKEHRIKMVADNNKIIDATSESYHNLKDAIDNRIMVSIEYIKHYQDKLTPEQAKELFRKTLVSFCDFLEVNDRVMDYSKVDEFLEQR